MAMDRDTARALCEAGYMPVSEYVDMFGEEQPAVTLKKDHRTFVAHCDECPESLDTDEDNFAAARVVIAEKGWRTFKGPDKEWANACPACVAVFAAGGRR
jgi:hypothetical protein